MTGRHLILAGALALLGAGLAQGAPALKLRSTTVSLPADYDVEYPAGPGAEAANAHCRACHSPSMALVQPPLSEAEWRGEVKKMMTVYKAPVPEDQIEPIVAYFTALSQQQKATAARD